MNSQETSKDPTKEERIIDLHVTMLQLCADQLSDPEYNFKLSSDMRAYFSQTLRRISEALQAHAV